MNNNILSVNIQARMDALGIKTKAELARKSGLGPSLISYYLSGNAQLPSLKKLQPLAGALQTTPEALLGSSSTWGCAESEEAELGHTPMAHGSARGSLGLLSGRAEGQTFDIAMAAGEFIEKWCAAFGVKPSRRAQIALTAAAISTFMHHDVDSPLNLPAEVLGEFTAAMLRKYRTGDLDKEGGR